MKKIVITLAVLFASVTGAFAQYYNEYRYPQVYYYDAWRNLRVPNPPVVYYVEPYRYQYYYEYPQVYRRHYNSCNPGVVLGDVCFGFQHRW